jgi:hypothetical protein
LNRWTGIAIAVGVVVVAAIWLSRRQHGAETAQVENDARKRAPASQSEAAWPPAWPYPSAEMAAAPRDDEIDLCGYGRVSLTRLPADMEAEADAAILRVADALERSADDRQRGLSLAVRAQLAMQNAAERVTGHEPEKCLESTECLQRQLAEERRAGAPAIDALARTASKTRDPQTYASALRACQSLGAASAATSCDGLSAAQWAVLDPTNGAAWFEVAREADNRKDTVAVEAALLRASRGRIFDGHATPYGELLAYLDVRYEPVRTLVLASLSATYFRQSFPQFQTVTNYCSKDKAADPARREICSALAHLLIERDTSLLGPSIGVLIGERLGWPEDWLALLRAENKALTDEILALSRGDTLSCEWSARIEPWLLGAMKYGEARFLRQVIAQKKAR